jgi:hypothetical protein
MRYPVAVLLCGLLSAAAVGQAVSTAPVRPPVPKPEVKKAEAREIDLAEHKVEFIKGAVLGEPLKLTTAADLKLSPLEPLGSNLKVDFKTECVLLFQWQGSGKDKLLPDATSKDGKTVFTFTLKAGASEDLRQHSRAFILPAGAEWKVVK